MAFLCNRFCKVAIKYNVFLLKYVNPFLYNNNNINKLMWCWLCFERIKGTVAI